MMLKFDTLLKPQELEKKLILLYMEWHIANWVECEQ